MTKQQRIEKIRIATTVLIDGESRENNMMDANDATEIIKDYIKNPKQLESEDEKLIIMLLQQILKATRQVEIKNLEIYNRDKGMKLIGKKLDEQRKEINKLVSESKKKINLSDIEFKETDEEEFTEEELDNFVDAVTEALGTKKKAKKGHK